LLAPLSPTNLSVRMNVLKAYVAAHDTQKPDIWAAREVTLSSKDHPEKVLVAIWDSGFDPAVYPRHLYTCPNSAPYLAQVLAFTDDGNPSDSTLYPLKRPLQLIKQKATAANTK